MPFPRSIQALVAAGLLTLAAVSSFAATTPAPTSSPPPAPVAATVTQRAADFAAQLGLVLSPLCDPKPQPDGTGTRCYAPVVPGITVAPFIMLCDETACTDAGGLLSIPTTAPAK
jgi:hypothetical protein